MKNIILSLVFALAATTATQAQTLQIDPIYEGGIASFEIIGGTPNATAVICYSLAGSGPLVLGNGLTFDLSLPINQFSSIALNNFGSGVLGPFPVPSNVLAGVQVWFQAVHVDIWANPPLTTTNMVPITIQTQPNNPPVAVDDSASVIEGTIVTIDVLSNDSDPDGDALSIYSVTAPANGTASIVGGLVDYAPALGFVGSDSFTYVVEDIHGGQDTGTVLLDVTSSIPTDMVSIPGGTFDMGDHAGVGSSDERPIHSVTLDAFYMDKYEVTNTKFADYLNAELATGDVWVNGTSVYMTNGVGAEVCYLSDGLSFNGSSIVIIPGKETHPVVNQTWYGACLYTNWLSGTNGRTPCYDEWTFDCDFTADGFRLPTEAE
nr:SUMF1/EgtB/PvdO family nonheme iron enzyme [Planctomycetota bacterium]